MGCGASKSAPSSSGAPGSRASSRGGGMPSFSGSAMGAQASDVDDLDSFEPQSFEEGMEKLFPRSFEAADWVETTASLLAGRGFTKENSLACISVCRDMLAVGLTHSVNETWGDAVDGSSIAGFLALGKTGLATLVQHAPPGYDRDRFVFIAMPHLSISAGGMLGSPEGLLSRFRKELAAGDVAIEADPLDTEYTAAKQKLLAKLHFGRIPSLATLTKTAADIAAETLDALIESTIRCVNSSFSPRVLLRSKLTERFRVCVCSAESADVAVLVGVQVRGPEDKDYIFTHSFYSTVNGEKMLHNKDLDGLCKTAMLSRFVSAAVSLTLRESLLQMTDR